MELISMKKRAEVTQERWKDRRRCQTEQEAEESREQTDWISKERVCNVPVCQF